MRRGCLQSGPPPRHISSEGTELVRRHHSARLVQKEAAKGPSQRIWVDARRPTAGQQTERPDALWRAESIDAFDNARCEESIAELG